MTLHIVRHASAQGRTHHHGHDIDRPLDDRGDRQAKELADREAFDEVTRVMSSPAVRCIETVAPLAARLGRTVETDDRLYEGHDPSALLDWLDHDGSVVVCSHGDVIPEALRLLELRGARLQGQRMVEKGCTWSVEVDGGRPTTAVRHPAP